MQFAASTPDRASDQFHATLAPLAVVVTAGLSAGLVLSTFTCTERLEEFPAISEHDAVKAWGPSPADADCCLQFAASTPEPSSVHCHATDTSELFHPAALAPGETTAASVGATGSTLTNTEAVRLLPARSEQSRV